MYAIVSTGGKQLRVAPGDVIQIEKIGGESVAKGDAITFAEVAFLSDGEKTRVGAPHLDGVSVKGTVLSSRKARKVLIFKKKRRKQYRRTKGHRQPLLEVRIDGIEA